jgi:uncharacterized membrane protein YdjX (TVP38/TMEM64 family)
MIFARRHARGYRKIAVVTGVPTDERAASTGGCHPSSPRRARQPSSAMTGSMLKRFAPLLVLMALAVFLVVAGVPGRLAPESLIGGAERALTWSSTRPFGTFALLVAAIALTTAVGLPGAAAVFAAAGFLLGVPAAMGAAALGNVVGTSALYFALRHAFFRPPADGLPDASAMQRIRAGFARSPLLYALFLRALPMLPNGAATAALAAVRCPWSIFLIASAIGPQGNAALMGWLGAQFAREIAAGRDIDLTMLSDPRWWLPLLLLAMLILVPVMLRRWSSRPVVAKP